MVLEGLADMGGGECPGSTVLKLWDQGSIAKWNRGMDHSPPVFVLSLPMADQIYPGGLAPRVEKIE